MNRDNNSLGMFWHLPVWRNISKRIQQNTLPHALLLSGPVGLGKFQYATQLARILLCEQPSFAAGDTEIPAACGRCHSCQLVQAESHPDQLLVQPESRGKQITVDQVRQVAHFLSLKSHSAQHQVVIVEPAENMNPFAANSLLKTLEEPTANSVLLLISHKPSALLPTIRSRCQTLNFTAPDTAALTDWLQQQENWPKDKIDALIFISNGAPLDALRYGRNGVLDTATRVLTDFDALAVRNSDPVAIAKNWLELDIPLIYQWLISWVGIMIRLKSCGPLPDNSQVVVSQLQKLAEQVDLNTLFAYFDKLSACYRLLNTQVNNQLMLEDCLIDWCQINSSA